MSLWLFVHSQSSGTHYSVPSYRYEMSNCLFEAAFEQILEDCKCAPGFHNEGGADAMEVGLFITCFSRRTSFKSSKFPFNHIRMPDMLAFQTYEVCTGAQLACSNEILNRMGQYNKGNIAAHKTSRLNTPNRKKTICHRRQPSRPCPPEHQTCSEQNNDTLLPYPLKQNKAAVFCNEFLVEK